MLSELRSQKTELLGALHEAKTELQKEAIRWYTSGVPNKEAGSSKGVEKEQNKGIDKSNCGKDKAEGATVCGENHSKKARKAVDEKQLVEGGLQQTEQQQPDAAT